MFLFLNLFPVKMCMETEIRTFIPSDILSESWALDDFASWWRNVGVVSPSVGGFSSESKLAQPNWPCFQGSFYMFVMFKHCGISSFMRILIMWSIWCSYKRFSLIQSQWRSGCTLTVWARWTPQQAWRWLKQGLRLEPCFFFSFSAMILGSTFTCVAFRTLVEAGFCHVASKEHPWLMSALVTTRIHVRKRSQSRPRSVVYLKAIPSCCGRTSCKHHANPALCRKRTVGLPPPLS